MFSFLYVYYASVKCVKGRGRSVEVGGIDSGTQVFHSCVFIFSMMAFVRKPVTSGMTTAALWVTHLCDVRKRPTPFLSESQITLQKLSLTLDKLSLPYISKAKMG